MKMWFKNFWILKAMLDKHPKFQAKSKQVYSTEKDGVILSTSNLAEWIKSQRKNKTKLTDAQLDYLESIEFSWVDSKMEVNSWDLNFAIYRKIKLTDRGFEPITNEFYHAEIKGTLESSNLGLWCKQQRVAYRKKKLTEDQVYQLGALGFVFDRAQNMSGLPIDEKWNQHFNLYCYFKAKKPDFKPKKRKIYSAIIKGEKIAWNITHWIDTQRIQKRKNILAQYRIDLLDSINFAWDVDTKHKRLDYVKMVDLLISYFEKNQKFPSDNLKVNGKPLGWWFKRTLKLINQDREHQDLSEKALTQLAPAMYIFDLYKRIKAGGRYSWIRSLKIFSSLKEENKKFYPEQGKSYKINTEGFDVESNLYKWVQTTKKLYRSRKLTKEQVSVLKSVKVI